MATIANLKQHFLKLCADEEAGVQWCERPSKALSVSDGVFELVVAPPIKSPISYAVAMHELGHFKSRNQSNNQIERERAAWEWAKRNAMLWTPRMERYAFRSLKWYERQLARAARKKESD